MVTSRQRKEEENQSLLANIPSNKRELNRATQQYERKALRHANKFLFKRISNLTLVQFRVVIWIVAVMALIAVCVLQASYYKQQYTETVGVDGGTYSEGIVGEITDLNPIFVKTDNEKALSRLMYVSLFNYDSSDHLRGELATTYTRNEDGTKYTINLRDDIKWNDGEPVTADDVIYTFDLIQNADIKATQHDTMQSVELRKISNTQIEFDLPLAQYTFPQLLNFGILPKHQYENVAVKDLREHYADNLPVVSGKYALANKIKATNTEEKIVYFNANKQYFGQKARISTLQIHTYNNNDALANAMKNGFISGTMDLGYGDVNNLTGGKNTVIDQISTNDGIFAIFNFRNTLLAEVGVRAAISDAIDVNAIRDGLRIGEKSPEVLLGYSENQNFDLEKARAKLTENGWNLDKTGLRTKNGVSLMFDLSVPENSSYEVVGDLLAMQLAKIGISINVKKIDPKMMSTVISQRSYDILLYQLRLGVNSDNYIYWHSSQSSQTGLNLGNYSSPTTDIAISAMRSAHNSDEYNAAQTRFYNSWRNDIPAIALYQLDLYFIHDKNLKITEDQIPDLGYKYGSVNEWTAISGKLNVTP